MSSDDDTRLEYSLLISIYDNGSVSFHSLDNETHNHQFLNAHLLDFLNDQFSNFRWIFSRILYDTNKNLVHNIIIQMAKSPDLQEPDFTNEFNNLDLFQKHTYLEILSHLLRLVITQNNDTIKNFIESIQQSLDDDCRTQFDNYLFSEDNLEPGKQVQDIQYINNDNNLPIMVLIHISQSNTIMLNINSSYKLTKDTIINPIKSCGLPFVPINLFSVIFKDYFPVHDPSLIYNFGYYNTPKPDANGNITLVGKYGFITRDDNPLLKCFKLLFPNDPFNLSFDDKFYRGCTGQNDAYLNNLIKNYDNLIANCNTIQHNQTIMKEYDRIKAKILQINDKKFKKAFNTGNFQLIINCKDQQKQQIVQDVKRLKKIIDPILNQFSTASVDLVYYLLEIGCDYRNIFPNQTGQQLDLSKITDPKYLLIFCLFYYQATQDIELINSFRLRFINHIGSRHFFVEDDKQGIAEAKKADKSFFIYNKNTYPILRRAGLLMDFIIKNNVKVEIESSTTELIEFNITLTKKDLVGLAIGGVYFKPVQYINTKIESVELKLIFKRIGNVFYPVTCYPFSLII